MPGIKGKRIPGRAGRFDPSEPLHMTTRRAAKGVTVNGSPSLNGSTEESEGRRGSFDDARPVTSHSNGSQFSVKSRRLSEISASVVTPDNHINGSHYPKEQRDSRSKSKQLSPEQQTPSPSRKRKRSSSPPAQATTPEQFSNIVDTSFESYDHEPTYDHDVDMVEVVHHDELSDREVPSSQVSSQSEEVVNADEVMAEASMDITPAVSRLMSPETSQSNSPENTSLAKPLGAALAEAAQAAQDEPDDRDDAVDAVEDIEDAEEVDDQARSDGDVRPRRGRFGGRRRAKHNNPTVERAMQRQSELKSAYRVMARAQKAVLVEIAQRTIDGLETNSGLHADAIEYATVKAGLDAAFEERRTQVQAQHELSMSQLEATLESHQYAQRWKCRDQFQMMRDEQLEQVELQVLTIARAAQLDVTDAGYETEDEDDIIPRPKGMGYRWKRTKALDHIYDSRSRLSLETRQAATDMEKRLEMRKLLATIGEEDTPVELLGFTIRDSALRDMAVEKNSSIRNVAFLAEAAAEIERQSIAIIPNEQALGLQLLGDLASRPSIVGSVPPPDHSRGSRDLLVGQTPSKRVPPHLQLQTNHGPSGIIVEMSPRTTQALGDRFGSSMPPPRTPRQGISAFIRSPEVTRADHALPSPMKNAERSGIWPPSPMQLSNSRPASRTESFSETKNRGTHFTHPYNDRQPDNESTPIRSNDRGDDLSLRREYPEASDDLVDRQKSSQGGSLRFGFPTRDERLFVSKQNGQGGRAEQESVKDEASPTFNRLDNRPPPWADAASQPGAVDARNHGAMASGHRKRTTSFDSRPSPPPRHSSAAFSVHDFRPSSQHEDEQHRQRHRAFKTNFKKKLSKEDRGGMTRRAFSKDVKRLSTSDFRRPVPASAVSPTPTTPSFTNTPVDRTAPLFTWQGPPPPQHSPLGPSPASVYGQLPYGYHPQPHYPASTQGYDSHQHRNSLPPQTPASVWNHRSPLYAVPQQQHPPPPGIPPDQYQRYPPPLLTGYRPTFPPHTPQTSNPQSASVFPTFGGQPLAPATTNPGYHPSGFRAAHPPPAFAQQAQQTQNNNFGPRRRTQSDTNHTMYNKFQPWQPPGSRR
ncbi:hypothetical protein LTR37_015856 [Vermiconidia calcicola]|uniref:Uncharacterized protein n=1 Tax=Vermiconidia calcicola TaxID=1690605 RepID=A0ACC3MPQ1_9PEZI|nr:hypothetical protein LTR37_015856 [Vermiconidia calcicola]